VLSSHSLIIADHFPFFSSSLRISILRPRVSREAERLVIWLYEALTFDNDDKLGAPKKSKDGDPRFRVSYIPERTWKLIDFWLNHRFEAHDYPGLLFPSRSHCRICIFL
jgi:hypothetical protein